MYNFIVGKGIGNGKVCGKRVEFDFEGETITIEILDKQKCDNPNGCHGVGLHPIGM